MVSQEAFEEFLEVLDSVLKIPVIVEGPNDVAALKELGFCEVHELDAPLYEVAERFSKKDVVQVLTDFDGEGKRLFATLRHLLAQRGVRLDRRLRLAVKETGVSHIEDLSTFVNRREFPSF